MAGFQLSIYGRFWVSTEANGGALRATLALRAGPASGSEADVEAQAERGPKPAPERIRVVLRDVGAQIHPERRSLVELFGDP
jgi:hypothetical protein